MQLIRKLIRNRSLSGRNHKIRGLSTAELIGIIIIVGILGALGGTYIGSLVSTANKNAIAQNVQSLDTVCASMLAGGVPITGTVSGTSYTITIPESATTDATEIDCSTDAELLNALNSGLVSYNGVVYRMTPPISQAAIGTGTGSTSTYTAAGGVTVDASGNVTAIAWSQNTTSGANTSP